MVNEPHNLPIRQNGSSMLMVLIVLIAVSILGAGGAQIALMSERGSRNDRDLQIAAQASEAALEDAERDMTSGTRASIFDGKNTINFIAGCGTTGNTLGLCDQTPVNVSGTPKPAWLAVDFSVTGANARTVAYGTFTNRTFSAGGAGVQPALVPRYLIELVPDPLGDQSDPSFIYRITAMGFGPRADIQSVVQILYRP
jgi:type IV pilus assembly protein PilX